MMNRDDSDALDNLCRQASQESDSNKLLELVKKINQLMDQKAASGRETDSGAQQKSA